MKLEIEGTTRTYLIDKEQIHAMVPISPKYIGVLLHRQNWSLRFNVEDFLGPVDTLALRKRLSAFSKTNNEISILQAGAITSLPNPGLFP